MELRNRRRRPKEDLPSLYSDIRRMMSLAYPGPGPSNVEDTVGRDAFLDALGDPELRARILERGVPTMDDALRTAMSLEVLDKSKENYKKSCRSYEEPFEDEPRRKKERRLAVNSVETVEEDKSESTVTQLQKALASCMKEMAEMRKTFGTPRGPPSQPNAMMQRGNRPPFNQARGAPTANRNLRPRVPNVQGTGGYRGLGQRQQTYVNRGSTQCFKCKQLGHIALNCPNGQSKL